MGLFQPRDPFREVRKSPRYEIHYLAQIDVEGKSAPLSCIIWDISASGAKLTVHDEQSVPDEFTLVFRRRCRVVRRFDGQVGVVFMHG
jgi:PilZ domain-containing protein